MDKTSCVTVRQFWDLHLLSTRVLPGSLWTTQVCEDLCPSLPSLSTTKPGAHLLKRSSSRSPPCRQGTRCPSTQGSVGLLRLHGPEEYTNFNLASKRDRLGVLMIRAVDYRRVYDGTAWASLQSVDLDRASYSETSAITFSHFACTTSTASLPRTSRNGNLSRPSKDPWRLTRSIVFSTASIGSPRCLPWVLAYRTWSFPMMSPYSATSADTDARNLLGSSMDVRNWPRTIR